MSSEIIRVGLIGCGEIAQVSHIPTLNFLSDYFQITYLCDISSDALEHCRRKVTGPTPKITKIAEELCSSSKVDAVLICNASAYHTDHALLALYNDNSVLVEKPLTSSYEDIEVLQHAERASKGRLMIGGIEQIQYARVRDIIGPNSAFVAQSGTYPKRFDDYSLEDSQALKQKDEKGADDALKELGVPVTDETRQMLRVLGGLGTHDLSAMREALGMPQGVTAAVLKLPIWTAIFDYGSFPFVYESGINQVPVFDAHIEVYGADKIVRVNYDTPYIKGLPTTMTVREKTVNARGGECYQERHVRSTYEDSYTVEFKAWYDCIVNGHAPKTTIENAREDVDLMGMLLRSALTSN